MYIILHAPSRVKRLHTLDCHGHDPERFHAFKYAALAYRITSWYLDSNWVSLNFGSQTERPDVGVDVHQSPTVSRILVYKQLLKVLGSRLT